jgi:putative oxidoreductase
MVQIVFSTAELAGRILLVAIFALESWIKLGNVSGTLAYMAKFSLPGWTLAPALIVEIGGALLVAIGWNTRLAAFALSGFCLVTAAIFHTNFASANEQLHFWKDVSMAGGFLVVFARGAGAWSLDNRR